MAVIRGTPPPATQNNNADTVPEADVTPETVIELSPICALWAEMSPAQAMGLDVERVLLFRQAEEPHGPVSLIGPPARQPASREVTIPAGGLRYTDRADIMDAFATLAQDCSDDLRGQWRRTLYPRSRCCMDGEEVRIDHTTGEVYK